MEVGDAVLSLARLVRGQARPEGIDGLDQLLACFYSLICFFFILRDWFRVWFRNEISAFVFSLSDIDDHDQVKCSQILLRILPGRR